MRRRRMLRALKACQSSPLVSMAKKLVPSLQTRGENKVKMSKDQRQSATVHDESIIRERASWTICCPIHIDESDGDPPEYPDHPEPAESQSSTESEGDRNNAPQQTANKIHLP